MNLKGPVFLLCGAAFGFLMSRAGATHYDFYIGLFTFTNLHLLWVILAAVLTGVIGVWAMRTIKTQSPMTKKELSYAGKPMTRHLYLGAAIFGIGWGISGTCPGAAPSMLGEGKLMALVALVGIVLGTYLYGLLKMNQASLVSSAPN